MFKRLSLFMLPSCDDFCGRLVSPQGHSVKAGIHSGRIDVFCIFVNMIGKPERSGNNPGMSSTSKQRRAVEAATEVFCRYGFHRTTMGDIASQAGMSRPALYLLFPDKDAIFTAVVRHMDEIKRAEIRDEIAPTAELHAKLLQACLSWGCHGVDLAAVHPDAADLFDLSFPVVQEVYGNFQALVAELIADQVRRSGIDAPPDELARTLIYGLRGLRETAADGTDMRRLITVLVDIVMRAIAPM